MAIRKIRELDDELGKEALRSHAKEVTEVTPRIRELIDDMFDTMYEANGVGLAAPQVGIRKRIVVVDVTGEDPVALINPVILEKDGEQTGYEGCLSVPGKTGIVTRANHVIVEAYNENMEKFTIEAEELMARALQHEIDHLDGVMYVDLVKEGELYNNEDLQTEE
jgi:peptide deformylase